MWHNRFLTVNLFAPPPTSLLSRIMKEMQLPIMYFKPIIDVIGFTFCRWRWTWLGHYEANPQGEERGKTKKSLHVWSGSAQYWTSNFLPQTYLYTTQSMKVIEVFFFKTIEADLWYGNPIFKCRLRFTDGQKRDFCFDNANTVTGYELRLNHYSMVIAIAKINSNFHIYIYNGNQESTAS